MARQLNNLYSYKEFAFVIGSEVTYTIAGVLLYIPLPFVWCDRYEAALEKTWWIMLDQSTN